MTAETIIKKLENGRAEFAYRCVNEAKQPDTSKYKENISSDYKAYIKKISPLVMTNGIGNTLAYIVSKGKAHNKKEKNNAYDLIYAQLSAWLSNENNGCILLPSDTYLLEFIISQPSTVYRQITTETLAFLNWLRRLSEGMIEGDEDE